MSNTKPSESPRSRTPYREQQDAELKLFSRRLWRLMTSKGWNQSELSRQTKLHDESGAGIGRDMISGYVRGQHLPSPRHARTLAATFGVELSELFPSAGDPTSVAASDRSSPELKATSDGKAELYINQEVSMSKALRILALLQDDVA